MNGALAASVHGFPVPLSGFTKAYAGEPIDHEKYREARKALLMQIRERQIELAKKAAEAAKPDGQEAPKTR